MSAVQIQLANERLLVALCAQITKDFGLENFDLSGILPNETAFNQLYLAIYPIVQDLEKNNRSKLNYIINRVDINERQISVALQHSQNKEYASQLTELIIKRELQKVVIRFRNS
jgi:hypothetical protein